LHIFALADRLIVRLRRKESPDTIEKHSG